MNTLISFFQGMLRISMIASIMILIVLFIKAVAKDRISIKIISLLWLLVILRLCLPGMVDSPVHLAEWFPHTESTAAQPPSADAGAAYDPGSAYDNTLGNEFPSPETDGLPEYAPSAPAAEYEPQTVSSWQRAFAFLGSLNPWLAAAILWMAGGAAVLLSAIRERMAFGRYVGKNSTPVGEPWILDILAAHQAAVRIRRRIGLSVCPSIHMPMAYGVLRPHILLPLHMTQAMDRDHIRAILLHEVCHIKSHDILKGYACILAKALHWFNPLVWLCVKNIKEDIEFSCDQRVLGILDPAQGIRYCESLLHVTRFMGQRRLPLMTTSLCEKKSNLKERILRMITPRRKSKPAAALSMASALIMIVACFTTACQPTPENEVVINKGDGKLEEIIASTDPPTADSSIAGQNTWVEEVQSADGKLFIKIDAAIDVPAVSAYPVIHMKPGSFTQEQVDSVIEYLSQGNPVFSGDLPLTKDEITQLILELESDYAKFKNGDPGFDDSVTADSFEGRINEYKKMLESAPDSHEHENGVTTLATDPETLREGLDLKIDMGRSELSLFTVVNPVMQPGPNNYASSITFCNGPRYVAQKSLHGQDASGLEITFGQAGELARQVLADLNLDDYRVLDVLTGVSAVDPGSQGYVAVCTPVIGDVPVTYSNMTKIEDPNIVPGSDGMLVYADTGETVQYVPKRLDECSIVINMDDTGVTYFGWQNICDILSTENENVQLLDFEEIKRIFVQQMESNFIYDNKENGTVYTVDRIALGLVTIPRRNHIGEFLLVPGWTFYGHCENADGSIPDDFESRMKGVSGYTSHLTLNAIDGSLVSD